VEREQGGGELVLTILIKGPPKSGKTTTAVKIAAMLKNNGERVKLIDETTPDHNFGDRFNDDNPDYQVVTEMER
jgi:adenylylsulfate kinase-like enzyme